MNPIYHYEIEQRSPEWYAIRLGRLTGSDFHTFLGNSETKKNKLLQKACERITGKSDEERFVTPDIQRGIDLEDEAVFLYEMQTGNDVTKVGFIEYDEWLGTSPDGLVGEDGIIECKAPKDSVFVKQVIEDKIKPEYYTQIQCNLLVSGRKWCDYVAYNKNFDLFIKRFERDEEYIKKILQAKEDSVEQMEKYIDDFNKRLEGVKNGFGI